MKALLEKIKWNADGHVPTIIANVEDNEPLTLCYLTKEALEKTLETGLVHVFRRSQGRLMLKGESSGHTQEVKDIRIDCEGKSLCLYIKQNVAGCHVGYFSCYFNKYDLESDSFSTVGELVFDPKDVYK